MLATSKPSGPQGPPRPQRSVRSFSKAFLRILSAFKYKRPTESGSSHESGAQDCSGAKKCVSVCTGHDISAVVRRAALRKGVWNFIHECHRT